jgi:hypothetical protein
MTTGAKGAARNVATHSDCRAHSIAEGSRTFSAKNAQATTVNSVCKGWLPDTRMPLSVGDR